MSQLLRIKQVTCGIEGIEYLRDYKYFAGLLSINMFKPFIYTWTPT